MTLHQDRQIPVKAYYVLHGNKPKTRDPNFPVAGVQDFEPLREIVALIEKANSPAVQDRRNKSNCMPV
jgi:hypothetical protein